MNNIIEYAPFTPKQTEFIKESLNEKYTHIVLEGGKRAGKNVISIIDYAILLDNHKDKLHLVAGYSNGSARMNVIDCNGYGLEHIFKGRCRAGKYKDNEALFIQSRVGEKIVIITGGGKSNSLKAIKGMTFGTAYLDEANELHISFIKECTDRLLASSMLKVIYTLNPKQPNDIFYTDILDPIIHSDTCLYGHFTIHDNLYIDTATLIARMNMYDKNSVWYKRDILGQRVSAVGIIYDQFVDSMILNELPSDVVLFDIGVDFGGNKSATVYILCGYSAAYKKVYIIDELYDDKNESPDKLVYNMQEFIAKWKPRYRLVDCFCDSAEQILIKGFRNGRLGVNIKNAKKTKILDRIRLVRQLMSEGRFYVMANCKHTINALTNAVWDDDGNRLDDGTVEIDCLDAMEYCIEQHNDYLIRS